MVRIVLLTAVYLILLSNDYAFAEPSPVEQYAFIPTARGASLSPDGNSLVLIGAVKSKPRLVIYPLDGSPPKIVPSNADPTWVAWKTDHRLLVSFRYVVSARGFQEAQVFGVDVDGRNVTEMGHTALSSNTAAHFLSILPDDPDHILMTMPGPVSGALSVALVDIMSGRRVGGSPEMGATSVLVDPSGKLRLQIGVTNNPGTVDILVRDTETDNWRDLRRFDPLKGPYFLPIAFSKDASNILYVLSDHNGQHTGIYEFDTEKMDFAKEIDDPETKGVQALIYHQALVGYLETWGKPSYFDRGFADDYSVVQKAMPGWQGLVVNRSDDAKRTLLLLHRGNHPAEYWLLDRRGPKLALTAILPTFADVPESVISETRPETYVARDGLNIPVLVTLPVSKRSGDPIPFVVLPHDGPTGVYDQMGYNPLVQFLVDRGYGVMQPQYRGSGGFSHKHLLAGSGEWGRLIGNDVTDGTLWAINKKLADPNHICIVGEGFGGYTALLEVAKNPSLYRCVAAIGAISDIIEWQRRYRGQEIFLETIDKDSRSYFRSDFSKSAELSAINVADKINVPVLLVHGIDDTFVPVAQSRSMESALRSAHKTVEAVYLDDVDHDIDSTTARQMLFRSLANFLSPALSEASSNK